MRSEPTCEPLKLATLFRKKAALHFGFLPAHQGPDNFHMTSHNGLRLICVAVPQGSDKPLLMVATLFPDFNIWRRIKAAVNRQLR